SRRVLCHLLDHVSRDKLGQKERPSQIDRQNSVEAFSGRVEHVKPLFRSDSRVVHQQIDPPKCLEHLRKHERVVFESRDVALNWKKLSPELFCSFLDFEDPSFTITCIDNARIPGDIVALLRQFNRNPAPDPPARSCNECNWSCFHFAHFCLAALICLSWAPVSAL